MQNKKIRFRNFQEDLHKEVHLGMTLKIGVEKRKKEEGTLEFAA